MNAYFIPYDPRNHYTTLVSDYLEKHRINILNKGITSKYKTILRSVFEVPLRHVKVIHVNWIETCAQDRTLKYRFLGWAVLRWVDLMKIYGAKIVWTVHNKTSHNNSGDVENTHIFYEKMLRRTDMVMVHCKETEDSIVEEYGYPRDKILNVPHGAYEEECVTPKRWQLSEIVDHNKFTIVTFGNIVAYKNIPLLIRAYKELNDKSLQLIIAGSSKNEDLLKEIDEAIVGTDIIFDKRFIPDEEMDSLFSVCDCVILPYEKESMYNSGVAVMAFSKGLPVIVSEFGAIKEISNRSFVYAYDFENSEENVVELKKQILKVKDIWLNNREYYSEIKEEAYNYAHHEINWDNICRTISNKYLEIQG